MKTSVLLFKSGIILLILFTICENSLAQIHKITIGEINYKSDKSMDSGDWVELWNYGNQTIDISNWILQGEKFNEFYIIPQGTTIGSNKRKVLVRDAVMFQQIYPGVDFLGPFVFRLSGKGQPIRLYDNFNMLYLEMAYNDTLPFPKTPDGHGKTLELIDPESDLNDGENWFAGCILGSPGSQFKPCFTNLVFSEINHSSDDLLDAGDWVEIRNVGNVEVNVTNWTFKNRKDTLTNEFKIPANTIVQPGEHLILAKKNKFSDYYPDVPNVVKPFEFGIRSHQEILKLYDENGKIYTSMFYNNLAPWPVNAGNNGITLELLDSSKSLCSATNWFDGCVGGSPGAYYSPVCLYNSINKYSVNNKEDKIYPNPFKTSTHIEIKTGGENRENLKLVVYDFTGRAVSTEFYPEKDINHLGEGWVKITFERKSIDPGMYFYRLYSQSNLTLSTGKLMIEN
ncbi:MAG: lamin tail domain-containing protein [Bacteroidetes bacterium]|nr:lamin tail domain-containing protein [Bacteroidota bacterium]HET6245226.1 lamin tail domain-containing protein [Bacteroidia bacterium]